MRSSTKLEESFARTLASREKELFLDTLLAHSEMNLIQLATLAKSRCRDMANQTSVRDLLAHAADPKAEGAYMRDAGRGYGAVSTRTAVDRREFDARVLEFVQGCKSPCTATEVRESLGGTPLQIRRALNRLIERGALDYIGQARGTRYTAS
jgi:hypothetical protein